MTEPLFNLFGQLPTDLADEQFLELLGSPNVRIERIVSHGQSSPADFWYDQDEHEWVAVLQGAARILLEGEVQPRELAVGDSVNIPAHCRHRVEWTDPNRTTVWLAVFYK